MNVKEGNKWLNISIDLFMPRGSLQVL